MLSRKVKRGGKSKKVCVKWEKLGKGAKRSKKSKSKKGSKKKRKLNPYFKLMINAKRKKLKSFKYVNKEGKEQEYIGTEHPRLGMIYRAK